jgi:hypothetical protein
MLTQIQRKSCSVLATTEDITAKAHFCQADAKRLELLLIVLLQQHVCHI